MKRFRRSAVALLAGALALGLVAAGCGDDDGSGGGGDSPGTDIGELKVGVLVPLTGDLSAFGGPGAQAANLAASQLNEAATAAGTTLNVTLVQEDTQTDPQAAQEAATKVIESDSVSCIAGPWASSETIPTAENVTIAAGVPLISPSATSPDITNLDDQGLVFRTAPSDALQGQVLAKVVADAVGQDAKINTASRNDAYGTALVGEFTKAWEAAGGTVAANVAYNPEAASLNTEAGQIVAGDPAAWVIIDFPDTWKKMGAALVRTGKWDPAKTFTADGLRSTDLPKDTSKEATEGMSGSVPTSTGAPAGDAFDALWKAEVGDPRQTFDAQNFDAVILCALAAAKAGSTDAAAIAAAIPEVSGGEGETYTFETLEQAFTDLAEGKDINYEGASGPIDLDANGDPGASNYGTWSYTDEKLVDSDEVIPFSAG